MDPRLGTLDERLRGIRVIAVSGGKGGVGKSVTSSVAALALSSMGYKVGLLDMDFSGPSDHIILGAKEAKPREELGVVPPEICGVKFMSIVYYSGENPSPLRGVDVSNALKEMLCITRWNNVDLLVIDMPPGMGEAVLDSIALMKNIEFLVVTTPSMVSVSTVKKFLKMLEEVRIPVLGVVENMKIEKSSGKEFGESFLGTVKFDMDLESTLGNPDRLMKTRFSRELRDVLKKKF